MALTLVTGGARSGKSRHAEGLAILAAEAPSINAAVVYVATGMADDGYDTEWSQRLAVHRARRPPGWRILETRDVAEVVRDSAGVIVVDCLGTWVTGLVDDRDQWDDLTAASRLVENAGNDLCAALTETAASVVVVTNEVGLAPVPTTAAGRWFQDELGRLNVGVAAVADRVHLVVCGRVLDLSDTPVVS